MREKPILFNTYMVDSIMHELKTVTRRVVKEPVLNHPQFGFTAFTPSGYISCRGDDGEKYGEQFIRMPYQPGDLLYVRERFCYGVIECGEEVDGREALYVVDTDEKADFCIPYQYCLDNNIGIEGVKWRPSIHMPKSAARIWLKVTSVNIERLQDITCEEIQKEGLKSMAVHAKDKEIAMKEFALLWNSTINKSDLGKYGWEANPYVWRIEFEKIKKPEGEKR